MSTRNLAAIVDQKHLMSSKIMWWCNNNENKFGDDPFI